MLQPQNQSFKYEHLFADIDQGRLKIPKFQRDFVWDKEKTSKLVDSILKGFPIGTFILWRTTEELRAVKDIGNVKLAAVPKGEPVSYVLDGQQRITSLFALRRGAVVSKDGRDEDFKDIFIDLSQDPEGDDEIATLDHNLPSRVSVHEVLASDITAFLDRFDKETLKRIALYKQRLTGYDFSVITLPGYPIDVAVEVFTRINTTGEELTLFEIMVAKTYDSKRGFDLAEKVEELLFEGYAGRKSLSEVGYGTLRPGVILQCLAATLCRQVRRKDILKLNRSAFVDSWNATMDAMQSAIDWVRGELQIPVSELLPYDSLLVPITYFFAKNEGKKPSRKQAKLLTQFFFRVALTERYSSAAEGKIGLDLHRIDEILAERIPSYAGEDKPDLSELKWTWFSASSAFCKAILCVYAAQAPKSLESNAIVKLDNSYLKRADSRNYHHFFPKDFLKKQGSGIEDWQANSIVNITLVDDDLNKRIIRARAPSDYLGQFAKSNKKLPAALASHLIGDFESFGIADNDYRRFIDARAANIRRELDQRLEPDLE